MKILIAFVLLIAGIAGCIIADANIIKAAFALLICGAESNMDLSGVEFEIDL